MTNHKVFRRCDKLQKNIDNNQDKSFKERHRAMIIKERLKTSYYFYRKRQKDVVRYQFLIRKSSYADKISKNDPKPIGFHIRKVKVTISMIDKLFTAFLLCNCSYYY